MFFLTHVISKINVDRLHYSLCIPYTTQLTESGIFEGRCLKFTFIQLTRILPGKRNSRVMKSDTHTEVQFPCTG